MRISIIVANLLGILAASPALAQNQLVIGPAIGIVAPSSGPTTILGRQIEAGANAAATELKAKTVSIDDQCTADAGRAAAQKLIEAQAKAAIGFLCTESLEAALPALKQAGIVAITVGARANSLTDKHDKSGWPLIRLAPRADGEAEAVARLLPTLWRDAPFAIVDDGTINGRDLADAFRAGAETIGLKPALIDSYRPDLDNQVGLITRLRRAGATNLFVGGARQDVAIIARDAAARNMPLVIAGGEDLRNDVSDLDLPVGTFMVGLPDWRNHAPAPVLEALMQQNIEPEGYVLPAYAAVQIAVAAQGRPGAGDFASYVGAAFETATGQVAFDAKGDLARSPYALFQWNGAAFAPLGVAP